MYLSRKMTKASLPRLAVRFGGFDNTTVMHASDHVATIMLGNPTFKAEVEAIACAIRCEPQH